MSTVTESPAWQALQKHQQQIGSQHMRDLFKQDPNRFDKFTLRFEDILFDFSKNRITDETLKLLRALATQADLKGKNFAIIARAGLTVSSPAGSRSSSAT